MADHFLKPRIIFFVLSSFLSSSSGLIELTTRANNPLPTARDLQDYVSRPIHWPEIVASSNRVDPPASPSGKKMDLSQPLRPGQSVDEIFGLGIFSVTWTCTRQANTNKEVAFVVDAPDGVPGIASDCQMDFEFPNDDLLELTMRFQPQSILAYVAIPVLVVDNWMALNIWLPAAVDRTPLVSFRKLMGSLYGIAGLAHAADLILGHSVLLTDVAGLPPFAALPLSGQCYAALWCAVGPLAYVLSRLPVQGGNNKMPTSADIGLIIYGLVEIGGAILSGNIEAWTNALGVQAVVGAAWVYSQRCQVERQDLGGT